LPAERFDHFMARANALYYENCDPFTDFITAPELTQVFGEIIGAWAKIIWRMMGSPAGPILAEAGPGRGSLMSDALRAFPEAEPHFIETSGRLRAAQAKRVPNATWHEDLETLPARPLIMIANEFLDALPVRQFVRRDSGWVERYVENESYVELPAAPELREAPTGSVREINEAALSFCKRLAARGGLGLFIDYGPMRSQAGESVQAIKAGQYASPLTAPGTADITAHVDFEAIAAVTHSQGPIKQQQFLTRLGLFERTNLLAQNVPDRAHGLRMAAERLAAPEAMGSLFKVLFICPEGFPIAPGFE